MKLIKEQYHLDEEKKIVYVRGSAWVFRDCVPSSSPVTN